jgi:hypothetical protein
MIVYVGAGSGAFRDLIIAAGHGQMVSRQVGAFRNIRFGRWAFDNGAWTDHKNNVPFNDQEFLWRVRQVEEMPLDRMPDWCVCPDMWGDASSLTYSLEWRTYLEAYAPGLKWYLAVQDYMLPEDVIHATKLERFGGLFIGGSNPWREATAAGFIELGHRLGLQVHLARINGPNQLQWAIDLGADSVDGTGWVRAGGRWLPYLQNLPKPQRRLLEQDKNIPKEWRGFAAWLLEEQYETSGVWRQLPGEADDDPRYKQIYAMDVGEFVDWYNHVYGGYRLHEWHPGRLRAPADGFSSEEELTQWKEAVLWEAEGFVGKRHIPPKSDPMKVCLIGCGKSKLEQKAPAKDLYTGALFRKSKAYAERACDAWAILSAEHGLLLPEEVTSPYDKTLCSLRKEDRLKWCKNVRQAIVKRWGSDTIYTVLAGEPYACATEGLNATYPLEGLGIGERLHWLNEALRTASPGVAR